MRYKILSLLCIGACLATVGCAGNPAPESMAAASTPAPAPEKSSEEAATKPADSGINNTIRWQTATEIDNFGFDVYRGDNEEGPFTRLTESPVPGAGTSDVPTQYSFTDSSIEPNTAYYYYVESISTDGEREQFTPVFRSKPKTPEPKDPS